VIKLVQVNFDVINDQCFINYLNFLVGKVYKILPISESEPDTLKDYLESLLIEVTGDQIIINKIKYDANFLALSGTLQYLIENKCSHKIMRREVFKSIKIIQDLQKKYD
jgi:hypothetical protein